MKIMDEEWEAVCASKLVNESPPELVDLLKTAFYAGFSCGYFRIMALIFSDEAEGKSDKLMQIKAEIENYMDGKL